MKKVRSENIYIFFKYYKKQIKNDKIFNNCKKHKFSGKKI